MRQLPIPELEQICQQLDVLNGAPVHIRGDRDGITFILNGDVTISFLPENEAFAVQARKDFEPKTTVLTVQANDYLSVEAIVEIARGK